MANVIADIMTVSMARLLKDDERVFHGVASPMAMVAILLAKELYAENLTYLNITGGVNVKPNNLTISTDSPNLLKGSSSYFSLSDIFDLSMRGGLDVAFLSGVQFDLYGNVNASVIGDYEKPKVRLPGGAGSAVLLPTVKKGILWRTKHDVRTFVDKCDFVTTRGNIHKIITPLCIFKYEEGVLKLDSIHPHSSLKEVEENTGFKLIYDEVKITEAPTREELSFLRRIDPKGIREVEF